MQRVTSSFLIMRSTLITDIQTAFRWAFADFASTEHATAALINPRNHSLDGRKLKVEYASPDAVRRGGGPREPDKHKGDGPRIRKARSAGYTRKKPESTVQLTRDGEGEPNEKERETEEKGRKLEKLEHKLKHKFGVEGGVAGGGGFGRRGSGKGERPKPGAALALAQRGTAAILPSQGQKITF